jgi:hypothetical protein
MTDLEHSLAAASSASIVPSSLTVRPKRPEDTPDGCRTLAAADLRRAADVAVAHVRWRYRHSADAWLARADLLDQIEATFQERRSRVARDR